MSMYGNLSTMSLPDLLNWASINRRTGILELERNKICKRIAFREGRIVACSSEDPPALLGQFLLSRGKINGQTLREALMRQETSGENLGLILEEMGVLSRDEIERQVAAKAEENIYGLFDWTDAVFRFLENAPLDPYTIEVNLSVEDILMRGAQRHDELERIRRVFHSSGVVLRRSAQTVPGEVMASPMARRILESINGERTLAEVLLHAHASEFLVIKFLFTLHNRGIIEIAGERPVDPESSTLMDVRADQPSAPMLESSSQAEETVPQQSDKNAEIEKAHQLIFEGQYTVALGLLNECYRAQPDDNYVRHLLLQAESGYLQTVRTGELSPDRIPVLISPEIDPGEAGLRPTDLFLLSMLDGVSDIKSLCWIAPLREVDLLQSLQRMKDKGLIEMREPAGSLEPREEEAPVMAVHWSD